MLVCFKIDLLNRMSRLWPLTNRRAHDVRWLISRSPQCVRRWNLRTIQSTCTRCSNDGKLGLARQMACESTSSSVPFPGSSARTVIRPRYWDFMPQADSRDLSDLDAPGATCRDGWSRIGVFARQDRVSPHGLNYVSLLDMPLRTR
jgi:hypothetical protein